MYLYSTIMKLFSAILLFWFGALTVQPAVAEVCMAMQSESCCKGESCGEEDSTPCKKEDANKCCMDGVCNPCLLCYCCYGATVEKDNLDFILSSEKNKLAVTQNQNALSGFLSSPFQPPEFV